MPVMQVDLRVGETIKLSGEGDVSITHKSKSGNLSRLEIDADQSVDIQPPQRESVRSVVSSGLTRPKG